MSRQVFCAIACLAVLIFAQYLGNPSAHEFQIEDSSSPCPHANGSTPSCAARGTLPLLRRALPQGSAPPSTIATTAIDIMHVDAIRAALHDTGTGAHVFVISDGANHLREAQAAGVVPADVWTDPNIADSGDEGTAMLQVVHAIAPGATLGICGAATSSDFMACLHDATDKFSADVIVTDLYFVGVYTFGGDDFLHAVRDFLEAHPNVVLVCAAGNDAQRYFSGRYVSSSQPVTIGGHTYPSAEDWGIATGHQSSVTNRLYMTSGETGLLELQWDGKWGNAQNIYQLLLLDQDGSVVAAGLPFYNNQYPDVVLSYVASQTGPLNIEIVCVTGSCDNSFSLSMQSWSTTSFEFSTPRGSIGSLAGLDDTLTVGAVNPSDPQAIQPYSAEGPTTVEFPSPDVTSKPDVVAPDCVNVMHLGDFPPDGSSTACGTSMAAASVAGALALLDAANVGNARQTLINSATDLGTIGIDNTYGWGLVDMQDIVPPAKIQSKTAAKPRHNATTHGGGSMGITILIAFALAGRWRLHTCK